MGTFGRSRVGPVDHHRSVLFRGLVHDLIALHERDPARSGALASAVLSESPVLRPPKPANPHSVHVQVVAIRAARPDVRSADDPVTATVVAQATEHPTRWRVHEAPPGAPSESMVEEIIQLLDRYLAADE